MRIKLISLILLAFVFWGCVETNPAKNNNSCTQRVIEDNGIDCFIEYFCAGEIWDTVKCQIILNDTIAVFRVQSRNQSSYDGYTLLKLNKQTADCFRSLLFELYSERNSALKDSIPNERHSISSTQDDLSVSLTIGDKKINEFFHVTDILASYENFDPFRPQFHKLRELIDAIILKVEYEKNKNHNNYKRTLTTPDWITEKFNNEYYETQYEISPTYELFPI